VTERRFWTTTISTSGREPRLTLRAQCPYKSPTSFATIAASGGCTHDCSYAGDRRKHDRESTRHDQEARLSRRMRAAQALIVATVMTLAALVYSIPQSSAQPCPDIGVAFARGTAEPPGVGGIGQAFVDSLRAQAFPRIIGVHAVNYPASSDFTSMAFTVNVVDGIRDLLDHVRGVVSVCPQTQMILGGYSQGAMVSAFATSDVVPVGGPVAAAPIPLPADIADHVAAVVLFGKPSGPSLIKYGAPAVGASPLYAAKLLELCAPGDPVCSGGPADPLNPAHGQYAVNGMAGQGAAFAVSRLPIPPPVLP